MKTMLTILTMLLAGSAFALPPDDPAYKDLQKSIERTQAEIAAHPVVVQESRKPAVVTVMEINPGVWKGSDGSTIRDLGPLGYTISNH